MNRIAVLTSGGDAPGMNAAIRAVVRAGSEKEMKMFGVRDGFEWPIVDATIIPASSSTKNVRRRLDPEMASTQKGGHWFYGMKGHVGVDARTTVIHSVVVTAANVHDSQVIGALLHGEETRAGASLWCVNQ